mgnify:CR=1 FL=1
MPSHDGRCSKGGASMVHRCRATQTPLGPFLNAVAQCSLSSNPMAVVLVCNTGRYFSKWWTFPPHPSNARLTPNIWSVDREARFHPHYGPQKHQHICLRNSKIYCTSFGLGRIRESKQLDRLVFSILKTQV